MILPYLRAGPHHVHCVSPSEKEGRVVVGSRGTGRTPQHKGTSGMISSYRIPPRKKKTFFLEVPFETLKNVR